jgi:hypothetical protein
VASTTDQSTGKTTETADGTTLLTKKEGETSSGAPDTYASFTVPENYKLDPTALESALPIFKELGLTQAQAQKLVDVQVARELAIAKGPQDAYESMRQEWRTSVTSDAEMGKQLDVVKADIGRALQVLPPDLVKEFKGAMDLTGAGDHPAFVKAMWKLSQFVVEGKPVTGRGPSPAGQVAPGTNQKPSAAKALYPNLS